MNRLYHWLMESDHMLTAQRKTHGYLSIQRAGDRKGLVIQADAPTVAESEAIRTAQGELERHPSAEALVQALQILEPHTHGVFMVRPRTHQAQSS